MGRAERDRAAGRAPGRATALLLLVTAAVAAAACGLSSGVRAAPARPGLVVVGYSTRGALQRLLRSHPAVIVRRLDPLRVVEVAPRRRVDDFLAAAAHTAGIRSATVPVGRAAASEPGLALGVASTPAGGALEWQYYATHADEVPDAVRAAAAAFTIAVVDTGVDAAVPDLRGAVAGSYDVVDRRSHAPDRDGHGTFVASLAGARGGDGVGIAGFGGAARILAVKIAGSTSFDDVDLAAGIVYAVRHGARIVNLSLAGPQPSPVERAAVEWAARRGVLLVAAAGNDGLAGNPLEYPAAYIQPPGSNGVGGVGLVVGASGLDGRRAPFSGNGSFVSLAAPGVDVFGVAAGSAAGFRRTALASAPGFLGGRYAFASGTSFAAPQVAGAAALVWAADPSLTALGVARIIESTASGHGVWSPDLGFGILDVAAAVARASDAMGRGQLST